MNETKNTENTLDFEAALTRLEEIARALENGNAQLETSLSLFEEGVKLIKECNAKLDAAEQKVKLLVNNGNGTYDEQPLPKTE